MKPLVLGVCMLFFAIDCLPAQVASRIPLRNWAAPIHWQPAGPPSAALTPDLTSGGTSGAAGPPLSLVAVTPCRVADTRGGAPALGNTAFSFGETRTLVIPTNPNCTSIPIAAAYSLNITVVPTASVSLGYITTWPDDSPTQPAVSTLDWGMSAFPNGAVANAAIVPGGAVDGGIKIYSSAPANIIVDINGYFAPALGGPSVIYQISTPQTISASDYGTTLNFDQKVKDAQNLVTTGQAWIFKAPIAGTYHISAYVSLGSLASSPNAIGIYVSHLIQAGVTEYASFGIIQISTDVSMSAGNEMFFVLSSGATVDFTCNYGRVAIHYVGP